MILEIEARPYSLIELYDEIAAALGKNPEICRYHCDKVNIARNLQQCIYDYYIAANPDLPEEEVKVQVTMLLAISGPKSFKTMKDNTVEVFDGFISEAEQ